MLHVRAMAFSSPPICTLSCPRIREALGLVENPAHKGPISFENRFLKYADPGSSIGQSTYQHRTSGRFLMSPAGQRDLDENPPVVEGSSFFSRKTPKDSSRFSFLIVTVIKKLSLTERRRGQNYKVLFAKEEDNCNPFSTCP